VSEPRQPESHGPATAVAQVCLVERDAAKGERLLRALDSGGSVRATLLSSASAALEHLRDQRCDVVVAADDLADSSCPTLLRRVQHEYPEVMRVVLTDRDGVEVFRRVPYAHQFFARSATPDALKLALGQCMDVRSLIHRAPLRALVSGSNALPAAPKLYGQLIDLLADPRCSMVKVVEIIERDLGMSTRLMQLVSSAFFGMATQITSLGACVGYLGLNAVRSLVLSAEITQLYPSAVPGFSTDLIHARALATSRLARRLASNVADEGQAFVAGLLHGVGQLVLAARAPDRFREALELVKTKNVPLAVAEYEVFGATDAHVAAYLLAIWGQPLEVVRAIAHQDLPERCDQRKPGMATLIYISKRLGQNPDAPLSNDPAAPSSLNEAFLAQVGVLDQLTGWRAVARRLGA
jgi:HD-like signal output (HDOD) protein